jgi:hypothetical protein
MRRALPPCAAADTGSSQNNHAAAGYPQKLMTKIAAAIAIRGAACDDAACCVRAFIIIA